MIKYFPIFRMNENYVDIPLEWNYVQSVIEIYLLTKRTACEIHNSGQ